MMIHAGTVDDIRWDSGQWVFLDIGFANKKRSCGLLIHNGKPSEYSFSEMCKELSQLVKSSSETINLVIEAPLSVAFDRYENPIGRRIEKSGKEHRYWYNGLGCAVMVAAMYTIRMLNDVRPKAPIRLFEGFVSFKKKDQVSNHSRDVLALRKIIMNPSKYATSIIAPHALKMNNETDKIYSALRVAGLDYGVPPVIRT